LKQSEIDILVKTIQSLADVEELPLPPPPDPPPPKQAYPYVTINGEEPAEPVGFTDRTKGKILIGAAITLTGIMSWLFFSGIIH
jgi:hypothetical protein